MSFVMELHLMAQKNKLSSKKVFLQIQRLLFSRDFPILFQQSYVRTPLCHCFGRDSYVIDSLHFRGMLYVAVVKPTKSHPGQDHLVRTQNFPKNKHFLPLHTNTCMCVSRTKKFYVLEKFCVRTK